MRRCATPIRQSRLTASIPMEQTPVHDTHNPALLAEPQRDLVLPLIRALTSGIGADPDLAVKEAIPSQYVIRAVPR
jgi:hypothetical protein